MSLTFQQIAEQAMAQAEAIEPQAAIEALAQDPNALLIDVRDETEVAATGIGPQAKCAPGRSIAWLADDDPDNPYRDPSLGDRSRRIITTCGMSPCYRGASAANVLTKLGFGRVAYVSGGMAALLEAGLKVQPYTPSHA